MKRNKNRIAYKFCSEVLIKMFADSYLNLMLKTPKLLQVHCFQQNGLCRAVVIPFGHGGAYFRNVTVYDYSYTHIIPAITCFLHFVATEDSPKARSSLETKCNASQWMESMTEDFEGIFVDSMRRNHLSLFLTKCEKCGRRVRASKKIDRERNN